MTYSALFLKSVAVNSIFNAMYCDGFSYINNIYLLPYFWCYNFKYHHVRPLSLGALETVPGSDSGNQNRKLENIQIHLRYLTYS